MKRVGPTSWLLAATVLLLALLAPMPARAGHQRFRMYTGLDGLSQLAVRALVQDSAGHLWAATQAGLNRFDGHEFHVYGVREGLRDERVTALLDGRDGTLWIGTIAGLDRLGPLGLENLTPASTPLHVRALALGDDGRVWCGTALGLASWDGTALDFVPELLGTTVDVLHRAKDGALWIGAGDGLFTLRSGVLARVVAPALRAGVYALTEDAEGRIWAGGAGLVVRFTAGVADELRETGELESVTALFVDDLGELWLGDLRGVGRWTGGALERFGVEDTLRISNAASIFQDRDGRIWIGGFGGLAAFIGRPFTIFDESDGLPSANSRPILRDRDGTLWVGTVRGLARWVGDRFEPVLESPLTSRYIVDLHEDTRGWLWGGTGSGLAIKTPEGWVTRPFGTSRNHVGSIVGDASGRVWFAQEHDGVFEVEGQVIRAVAPPDNTLSNPRLLLDRRGWLWVSGDQGISVLRDGRWRTFGVAEGLAHPSVYYIAEDTAGNVWFGYNAAVGVTRFDGHTFRTFTRADGLADDMVFDIGPDPRGGVWIGSTRGVAHFDGRTFQSYGPSEGFASTETNAGGFLADVDGRLWFGTAEGLCLYDPRRDLITPHAAEVQIETLRLGRTILEQDGVEVPHRGDDLVADVDVLSFVDGRHIEIRARVLGISERWIDASNRRLFVPQLGPGTYRLEVQARVQREPWSRAATRGFVVTPAWWRNNTTQLAFVVALAVLGLGIWRWRLRALELRNQRLEVMVAERTQVLREQARSLEAAQASLQSVNAQLVQANRAKSEFVANVSHDLRTPMNGVLGMTELALSEALPAHVRHYLETAHASGQVLLELINELLDLSKIEAGQLELQVAPFDLRVLLDELRSVLGVSAEKKGLSLTIRAEPGLARRWIGDAHVLRRVLVNLVGNAIKFTPKGHVAVEVERVSERVLRFRVRDTGIGIPAERIDAIFEMFTQADGSITRQFGGSGLGLTISRQLVQLMGGEIEVESAVGRGSVFSFTVVLEPAIEESALAAASAEEAEVPAATDPLRVLVAEDNSVNQLVVRRMLEMLGHQVTVVGDGAEAVQATANGVFDVVLMDVQMPNVDGVQAVEKIRARERSGAERIPIIALTAHGMAEDRERSLAAGMDAYLTKPISARELATALSGVRRRA
ncbi:ATP-binding protein [Myxococcota bacterium]|nr:ATP-binding protein [Myxococcota bacterium]